MALEGLALPVVPPVPYTPGAAGLSEEEQGWPGPTV